MKLYLLTFDIKSDNSNGYALVASESANTAQTVLNNQGSFMGTYNIYTIKQLFEGRLPRAWENTIVAEGITSRGEKGEKGTSGNDGYTPVKGVDYFTNEEIKNIETTMVYKFSESTYITNKYTKKETDELLENYSKNDETVMVEDATDTTEYDDLF